MLRGLMTIRVSSIGTPFFDIPLSQTFRFKLDASGEVVAATAAPARDPVFMRIGSESAELKLQIQLAFSRRIGDRSRNLVLPLLMEAFT